MRGAGLARLAEVLLGLGALVAGAGAAGLVEELLAAGLDGRGAGCGHRC